MWIKICGITSLENAQTAVAAGADAIGFVFAESPRRVSVETAREIATQLPPSIEKVGVFVDSTLEEVLSAIQSVRLTGVQLHGENTAELTGNIRRRASGATMPLHILRVLRYERDAQSFERVLRAACSNETAETVLIDTQVAGKQGGTGVSFNWVEARKSILAHAPHLRLVAAGGLTPENVREAIHVLQPWGVDVSSGVESSPGQKHRQRVVEFIRAARAAAAELEPQLFGVQR